MILATKLQLTLCDDIPIDADDVAKPVRQIRQGRGSLLGGSGDVVSG